MEINKLNDHYQRMVKFLEKPLDKEYEPLVDRIEKLGILLAKAGEYMVECQYKVDEVIDIDKGL